MATFTIFSKTFSRHQMLRRETEILSLNSENLFCQINSVLGKHIIRGRPPWRLKKHRLDVRLVLHLFRT